MNGQQDLFSVHGKVAVVTGGSRGIGCMAAEGLVRGGSRVYIASRDPSDCRDAAERLSSLGSCLPVVGDLATQEGRQHLVAEVEEREDQVDVLVNNAGTTWAAPIDEFPLKAWDKVLTLNLLVLFELTRLLLPLLRKRATLDEPSRVINVGSLSGLRFSNFENYAYVASKAGVHMLTRQLARQMGPEHITVNAIAPGPFPTKMMAFVLEQHEAEITASIPLGRVGQAEDVMGIVLFLASRAGSYLTGTVIPVDGGSSC